MKYFPTKGSSNEGETVWFVSHEENGLIVKDYCTGTVKRTCQRHCDDRNNETPIPKKDLATADDIRALRENLKHRRQSNYKSKNP